VGDRLRIRPAKRFRRTASCWREGRRRESMISGEPVPVKKAGGPSDRANDQWNRQRAYESGAGGKRDGAFPNRARGSQALNGRPAALAPGLPSARFGKAPSRFPPAPLHKHAAGSIDRCADHLVPRLFFNWNRFPLIIDSSTVVPPPARCRPSESFRRAGCAAGLPPVLRLADLFFILVRSQTFRCLKERVEERLDRARGVASRP